MTDSWTGPTNSCEHDWVFVCNDWEGDPDVPGGVHEWGVEMCTLCEMTREVEPRSRNNEPRD
jgi:hypothetical protein